MEISRIGTNLNANGGDSEVTPSGYSASLSLGLGKLGGKNGGLKNSTAHGNASGTGGGKFKGGGVPNNFVGGGGGYGSAGQYHSNDTAFGKSYGSTALTHLHGGSGGGGAFITGGGAGGGAISLEADGNGTLTIQAGATISANGGGIASTSGNTGGGGSGGSIRLAGKSITNNGSIQAKGGTPPTTSSTYDGGIGGGGRVAFNYSTNLVEGTVDVGSGAYVGTKAENTPPTISSALIASITYSNDNYRKRSTVRYDDLVFWYPLDETSGSIAVDYSTHERNATLMNMSGSNRIAGKSGGALSFTTTPLDLSTQQTSGQYLDLGDWSFGGDFTFSAWVRVDYTNINDMTLMGLSNGHTVDDIMFRQTNTGQAQVKLLDTAEGTEESISNPFYTAGQWIHLLLTMNEGGANASTVKVYKDGSLFHTSAADLSPPLVKTRTEQFIGRSTSHLKYFQGDLDDLRLYDIVLTDSEISSLYGEAATGIHYQVQALNNPTGFSATGLPSGLSIDPTTGAITGQTTAVGDHNITLTASNLSGTSPSKNLILTVAPEKPLFETEPFDPVNLADLKLWLDAADTSTITHSSNAVSQWNDKSGNNNHAAQATTANKPTLTTSGQNGKSVITFDGSDDYISSTGLNVSQSYSIFLVAKSDGTSSGSSGDRDYLFDGIGSNSVRSLVALNNTGRVKMYAYNSAWADSGFNTPTGYFVLSVVFNTSSSSLALNGTNVTGISVGNSSLTNGIRIGANCNANNDFLDGSIAEFFILDETSSADTIAKAEGYLAHKWGLTSNLPSNHPHKQSIAKQPKIAVSSIGTNSATVSADLLDLGGESTSLYAYYGEVDRGKSSLDSPKDYPNLKLWLDASDSSMIVKDSSNRVSLWKDKSGNSNDANQTDNAKQAVIHNNVLNSMPVLRFDGSDDFMKFSGSKTFQTFFLVLNSRDGTNFSAWRWPLGGYTSASNKLSILFGRAANSTLGGSNISINGDSTSNSFSPLINHKIVSISPSASYQRNDWKLATGDAEWKGDFAEIIAYSDTLSPSETAKVERYLARKWGLSLPASHASWQFLSKLNTPTSLGQSAIGMNDLTHSTSYVVRVKATNSAGSTWSDAFSFTTGSVPNPPALSVSNPTAVGNTTATTKGNLLSFDGSYQPHDYPVLRNIRW
jgi:hypothetical protein